MANYAKDAEALADRVRKHLRDTGREAEFNIVRQEGGTTSKRGHSRWVVTRVGASKIPVVSWSAHSGHGLWQVRAESDLRKAGLLPSKGKKSTNEEETMPTPTAEEKRRSDVLRPRIASLVERYETRAEFARAAMTVREKINVEPFGGFGATSPEHRIIDIQLSKFLDGSALMTNNLDKWEALLAAGLGQNGNGPHGNGHVDPLLADPEPGPGPEPDPEPEPEPARVEADAETQELLHEAETMLKRAEEERDEALASASKAQDELVAERADHQRTRDTLTQAEEEVARLREGVPDADRLAQLESDVRDREASIRAIQEEREQERLGWEQERASLHERVAQAERRPRLVEDDFRALPLAPLQPMIAFGGITEDARRRYLDVLVRLIDRTDPHKVEESWLERLDVLAEVEFPQAEQ